MREKDEERPAAPSTPAGQLVGFLSRPPSFVPLRPAAAKKGAGLRHAASDADKRQWGGGLPADCTSAGLRSPHQHASSHFGVGRGSAVCGISPIQSPADRRRCFFVFGPFFFFRVWLSAIFCSWLGRPRDEGESRRHENATLPCPGFMEMHCCRPGGLRSRNHGTFLMPAKPPCVGQLGLVIRTSSPTVLWVSITEVASLQVTSITPNQPLSANIGGNWTISISLQPSEPNLLHPALFPSSAPPRWPQYCPLPVALPQPFRRHSGLGFRGCISISPGISSERSIGNGTRQQTGWAGLGSTETHALVGGHGFCPPQLACYPSFSPPTLMQGPRRPPTADELLQVPLHETKWAPTHPPGTHPRYPSPENGGLGPGGPIDPRAAPPCAPAPALHRPSGGAPPRPRIAPRRATPPDHPPAGLSTFGPKVAPIRSAKNPISINLLRNHQGKRLVCWC